MAPHKGTGVNGVLAKAVAAGLCVALAVPVVALAASNEVSTGSKTDAAAAAGPNGKAEGAVVQAWETDLDCAACHESEAASTEDKGCLAQKHAAVACTACHADGDKLQQIHDNPGKRLPKRLKKTSVQDASCLTCHGGADGGTEDLAKATEASSVLTDKQGLTVNPHALPVNASHQGIACITCHKMHADEADLSKQAQLACLGCHHENVYECGTCHAH